jgi:hypothetical protein
MGEQVGIAFGEVDPRKVDEVRSRIPAIRHRRAVSKAVSR